MRITGMSRPTLYRYLAQLAQAGHAEQVGWGRWRVRTRPAREKFLQRFEREVDPDGKLPPDERRRRAEHAKRAYMLRLAKRAVNARKAVS
jgi:hypothetical protein